MKFIFKKFDELDSKEVYEILKIRSQVFVVQQKCAQVEIDGRDYDALHLYLEEDGQILAYLRILQKGVASPYITLGRILAKSQRKGHGSLLVKEALRLVKEDLGEDKVYIEAQTHAGAFYENLGFRPISDVYDLDGTPHIEMIADL